jgi:hypothetical protein
MPGLLIRNEEAGKPIAVQDAMIAATARAYGLAIATRNGDDFAWCGVQIVNPLVRSVTSCRGWSNLCFDAASVAFGHTNLACLTAAAMNPANSGCGSNGFDFSSG